MVWTDVPTIHEGFTSSASSNPRWSQKPFSGGNTESGCEESGVRITCWICHLVVARFPFPECSSTSALFRIILCLPSNATHILQPLDVVFFNPLKIEWKKWVFRVEIVICFVFSVLRLEYNRTRNQVVGKAQFPSLLKQLWQTQAITGKTNVVKSFMKAGVFPLNPKSIHHSRILKTSASLGDSSLITTNAPPNNQATTSTITHVSVSSADRRMVVDQAPLDDHESVDDTIAPPFTSSREAVSFLDQVLQDTMSDGDDEVREAEEPISSQSTPSSSASESLITPRRPTSKKKTITMRKSDSVSRRKPTRRKVPVKKSIIGFNTSDEEGVFDNHRVISLHWLSFLDVTIAQESSSQSDRSLQAINATLQSIFTSPSSHAPSTNTKRTVLKGTNGRIMTEKTVIEEMEEQRNRANAKKARPVKGKQRKPESCWEKRFVTGRAALIRR